MPLETDTQNREKEDGLFIHEGELQSIYITKWPSQVDRSVKDNFSSSPEMTWRSQADV